jgi:hypothetical protein
MSSEIQKQDKAQFNQKLIEKYDSNNDKIIHKIYTNLFKIPILQML